MKKHLTRLFSLLLALVLLIAPASALTVDQALDLLEEYFYYEIPDEAYEAESMDELIRILGDPYTSYMSPEAYQAFLAALEGDSNTVGIGVTIQYTDQGILILETISGGSAREAGFQAGDLIVEVDGVSCVPASSASGDLLTGSESTQVSVTILRDGQTSTHVLTRRPVIVPNTEIQILDGGIGYIDCNSFGQDTGEEFAQLVRNNDSKVSVWLLDLRGNGGGYVSAAVEMVDTLAEPGRYVYLEYGNGAVEAYTGSDTPTTKKPVIVLTDGGSASASEMMSSNIRDLGLGITVGGRTYGKGVAQYLLDSDVLPEYFGDGDCLRLTVYRFYSAEMNTTDRIGVIPTLLVDDDKTADVALALCGNAAQSGISLRVNSPNASGGYRTFYVAPGTDSATLSALLSALPPQIRLGYSGQSYTPAQLARLLGIEYDSRWFDDVSDSAYADAINAMGAYELLEGDGKGNFTPRSQLTRAQLCAMLARVLNVAYNGPTLFDDVEQSSWYGPYVNAMAYLGLVEGTGNGKFNPGATLTQEQFLTIMGRAARFLNLQLDRYGQWAEDEGHFALYQRLLLKPYSSWARSSMAVLAWGVEDSLNGRGDMLFAPLKDLSPKSPILREEAAAGMYAVLSGLDILPKAADQSR